MAELADHMGMLDEMVTSAIDAGVAHHAAEDWRLDGRTIQVEGNKVVNFSSCSYLGLELDTRLIAGAAEAAGRYGTQFSSSRVYLSAPAYRELEETLGRLFGGEAIVAPSTTLGHLSALPVLVGPRDAVLLDHHVHNSVQMATGWLRHAGSHVELIRHHDLERLEERTHELAREHDEVWFLVDGVCSMFGDLAPMAGLRELLARHDALRLYVDDAHGMSWCGPNGRGYALSEAPLHPQMVLVTSLNKAFGAAGGVIVLPDAERRRRVRTCGSALLFSGPIQPPMLGAALASARIHLSPEIDSLQTKLRERALQCHTWLKAADLITPADPRAPIQYVEVGLPREAQHVVRGMIDDGYFPSIAQFPAVPVKRSGVRFGLNLHQREDDVRGMIESLTHQLARLEQQRGARRRPGLTATRSIDAPVGVRTIDSLRVERVRSIRELDVQEWDRLLGARANFAAASLALLEACFRDAPEVEHRWAFYYYVIRDADGHPLAATFCTRALWKADMLADRRVSERLELERTRDPLHLTHRVFSMGCLLTEGDHLYLARDLDAPGGIRMAPVLGRLLEAIQKDAKAEGCANIVLRDLDARSEPLGAQLREQGFHPAEAPESFELRIDWEDREDFLRGLSKKSRRHQRQAVAPFDDAYRSVVFSRAGEMATTRHLDRFEALYRNVKHTSLDLNTFDLPRRFFEAAADRPGWEIIALFPSEAASSEAAPDDLPVAAVVNFVGEENYVPLVIGLDYDYVRDRGLYRQCIRAVVERARERGCRRVNLGMGAPLEKARFGAKSTPRCLFVQSHDHYIHDVIAQMSQQAGGDPQKR